MRVSFRIMRMCGGHVGQEVGVRSYRKEMEVVGQELWESVVWDMGC